jgi:hypothetical protein
VLLFYRAALRLSLPTLNYTAGLIRRHRKRIGSKGRLLNPSQQALLVLVYLRKCDTFAELAAAFAVSTATAWRYVNETVELLAARSARLDQALRSAKRAGNAYVVLDGTVIPIDRVAEDRPFYSGKHKKHGMICRSSPHPGRDRLGLRGAARQCPRHQGRPDLGHPARPGQARLIVLADKGYHGAADHVWTPYRGKNKPALRKEANRAHAKLRGPG